MGPLIPLFRTSGEVSSGFKARVCSLIFTLGRGICVTHSSGASPADHLAASTAAKPSLPYTCEALVGLKSGSFHAAAHTVNLVCLCQLTNYIVDHVQLR